MNLKRIFFNCIFLILKLTVLHRAHMFPFCVLINLIWPHVPLTYTLPPLTELRSHCHRNSPDCPVCCVVIQMFSTENIWQSIWSTYSRAFFIQVDKIKLFSSATSRKEVGCWDNLTCPEEHILHLLPSSCVTLLCLVTTLVFTKFLRNSAH